MKDSAYNTKKSSVFSRQLLKSKREAFTKT